MIKVLLLICNRKMHGILVHGVLTPTTLHSVLQSVGQLSIDHLLCALGNFTTNRGEHSLHPK